MRAKDDYCENFIIDDHISWFVGKNKQDFPEWFLEAYTRSDIVPGSNKGKNRKVGI